MNVLLDNLSSTLVFATVALVLAATQFRMQKDTAEVTIAYMAKKQLLSFAEMIEDEYELIGEGISGTKIQTHTTDANGKTTSFVFNREISSVDTQVEYRLVATDTVQVQGRDVPIYRVDRFEAGVKVGGGPALLTDFRVDLLTSTGGGATTSTAELVRIRMSLAHTVGDMDDSNVNVSYWGMTLRPIALSL
ncbi:MAG: hypothetical protein JJ896_07980 [Rhodothermales bacterium]|nr:hypothetical protein [Rhodothermales bacterium]MBO6779579.1 hypothetical protein [Rhodothermales bacterium]